MAGLLIKQASPHSNLQAIVEVDDRVVYFYLNGEKDSGWGPKSCWVRNLRAAPEFLDVSQMKYGIPPMMPASQCAHPSGAGSLDPQSLRIVWFEEGDGAALLDNDDIIAVIPGWSGQGGFHGYSRDCTGPSPIAWPLVSAQAIIDRVRGADEFWKEWSNELWKNRFDECSTNAIAAFGPITKSYGIDGGQWPPKALLRFDTPDKYVLITAGVHLRPQPMMEGHPKVTGRRIELALAIAAEVITDDDQVRTFASYISAQSTLPWKRFTWLGEGHTIPINCVPQTGVGAAFQFVLLSSHPALAATLTPGPYRGDCISVLWMIPITQSERAFAEQESSDALLRKLTANAVTWVHRPRNSVV